MQISFEYPAWLILIVVLASGALAYFFYYKDRRLNELSLTKIRILGVLRFLALLIIGLLLLKPFIKTEVTRTEKPILAVGIDNSESMQLGTDSADTENVISFLQQLPENLADYQVDFYLFGDAVNREETPTFKAKITNLADLATTLQTNYANRNLAGTVILSDGIVNRGVGPELAMQSLSAPVYTIGLGDTTARKDLSIKFIRNNELAYLGNDFPVEVAVEAQQLKGKSATLKIFKGGKELKSRTLDISDNAFFQKAVFTLSAEEEGTQSYRVVLSELKGETNNRNNSRNFYIEILDAKQRILMLANAPHPDVAAVREALGKNINNQVEVRKAKDFKGSFKDFNLVILHQVPGNASGSSQLIKQIAETNTPLLFMLGVQSNVKSLNALNLGISIKGGNDWDEVRGYFKEGFSAFDPGEKFIDQLGSWPPLRALFGEYDISNSVTGLLYQQVGPVKTEKPLVAFAEVSSLKRGFILGEGLWRWRIKGYQKNGSHGAFDRFVQKTAQFLAVKEDKSRFRLNVDNAFFENEPVVFTAELYDETYELTTDAEVDVDILNEEGERRAYKMMAGARTYRLDAGSFPPGEYSYTASTSLAGEQFQKTGTFTVKALQLESANLRANYNLLGNIALNTGGRFYTSGQTGELLENLSNMEQAKSVKYAQTEFFELVNLKWIFFVILVLMGIEWFVRKRNGAY